MGALVLAVCPDNEFIVTLRDGALDKTSYLDLWLMKNDSATHIGERRKDFLFNMLNAQEHAELWIQDVTEYTFHDTTEDTNVDIITPVKRQ